MCAARRQFRIKWSERSALSRARRLPTINFSGNSQLRGCVRSGPRGRYDTEYHGQMTMNKVDKIINKLKGQGTQS